MKTQVTVLSLIALLTLCVVTAKADVNPHYVRIDGNARCLDFQAMTDDLSKLPGDHPILNQVTDIRFENPQISEDFKVNAIQELYVSETTSKAKAFDGSIAAQSGCDSFVIVYGSGRRDEYKITAYTENSLTLVAQNADPETLEVRRLNDQTIELKSTTQVGVCLGTTSASFGNVQVTQTSSWASPLPTVAPSQALLSLLQETLQKPSVSCQNN